MRLFQVIEVAEAKDKKGRRSIEYLIHFQGKLQTKYGIHTPIL